MTSLESIAEKISEAKKLELEKILSVSGSAAISKNEYNITVVDDANAATSLIFKKLNKLKYDKEELLKAIDVEVKELKPNIPTNKKDLVPKPLYDEQVLINSDLNNQIKIANDTIDSLNSQIANIKIQLETEINNRLSVEQSNDALVNQLDTLSKTIDDFATQISTALQKSIEESILRTSLQAQNTGFKAQIKALIKQIDSLNSIIEGLQSQLGAVQQQQAIVQGTQAEALAAGADVVNDIVVVKIKTKEDSNDKPIAAKINAKGGSMWINGQGMTIINNDKKSVNVTISSTFTGPKWFTISETTFSIEPGGTKEILLNINEGACSGFDSKRLSAFFGTYSHSEVYDGGNLTVNVSRADGVQKSKDYGMVLYKKHPKSY